MIAELDPVWALYLKDNPYVLGELTLAGVIMVLRLLLKYRRRDLSRWPLGVALVIALLLVGLVIDVIVKTPHPFEGATTMQRPTSAASAVSVSAPPAPKNMQIVQGNNNTVISQ